jgi:hypothetical protein
MAGTVSDDGIKNFLTDLIAGATFGALRVRLFSNNYTPDNAMVIGSFTECTFAGYAAVAPAGWTVPVVAAHLATSQANPVTFTITAGTQNVYGYYVTNVAGTVVYFAERDPAAPVVLAAAGTNSYQVTPTYTEKSQ